MSGRIALATSAELPNGDPDDRALVAVLKARGLRPSYAIWTDQGAVWEHFDLVLVRSTWDYTEDRARFLAWARSVEARTRLVHGAELFAWNTDKRYLRELERAGAAVVPTHWLERGSRPNLERLVSDLSAERAFLKPVVGATSRETLRFDADPTGLAAAHAHMERLLPRESLMLQPYLESVEHTGELSAVFIDGAFTHGVRKIPVPGDYRVQDDFGARDESYAFSRAELDRARAILTCVHAPWLYARVDFLRSSEGELLLNELEVVEPSLFFRHGRAAAERLAEALAVRLE